MDEDKKVCQMFLVSTRAKLIICIYCICFDELDFFQIVYSEKYEIYTSIV